jgi:DNA-binding response OmpR family regulator
MIEDDAALAATVRVWLEGAGYVVWHVESGADADRVLSEAEPDLILLDLVLPDIDGLILCSRFKAHTSAPIVIASARHGTIDRVLGLRLGADDFVPKPFDLEELQARLEAVLRRARPASRPPERTTVRVGTLSIELGTSRVTVDGRPLAMSAVQYRVLLALASRDGQVVSRQALASLIWGRDTPDGVDHLIDTHVSRLRHALAGASPTSPTIVSLRGRGYRLEPAPGTNA